VERIHLLPAAVWGRDGNLSINHEVVLHTICSQRYMALKAIHDDVFPLHPLQLARFNHRHATRVCLKKQHNQYRTLPPTFN
jgi:hypothetical protein